MLSMFNADKCVIWISKGPRMEGMGN
uniref:Uncharacterized protein n=1 Tax=Anguilla anguilla TaxID=7936 RepID=A0A0E9U5R4_ANGAN